MWGGNNIAKLLEEAAEKGARMALLGMKEAKGGNDPVKTSQKLPASEGGSVKSSIAPTPEQNNHPLPPVDDPRIESLRKEIDEPPKRLVPDMPHVRKESPFSPKILSAVMPPQARLPQLACYGARGYVGITTDPNGQEPTLNKGLQNGGFFEKKPGSF
ncbi:hypothetical protein Salat_2736500 [Sesamum alatum]|uniref:Uncharacterized protein n=1 Tax=Sesamum alatum TaxID=300844 RepID=A0AAE2C8R4_9LAMI|nr:hypothetical protein Salat_2736500 [Sesamum alatum]